MPCLLLQLDVNVLNHANSRHVLLPTVDVGRSVHIVDGGFLSPPGGTAPTHVIPYQRLVGAVPPIAGNRDPIERRGVRPKLNGSDRPQPDDPIAGAGDSNPATMEMSGAVRSHRYRPVAIVMV